MAKFRGRWWFGGDPCVYCGNVATTKDHIKPVSRGGHDHWTNYAPCCRVCNSSRGNRPLLVWLMVLERKRHGKIAARKWQSRSVEYTKRREFEDGLHVSQWLFAGD